MAQTKADRQAAAKKAAATRQRNQVRNTSQNRGQKAASTRQANEAVASLDQAKRTAKSAVSGIGTAAKYAGEAAKSAGKAAVTRAASVTGRR
jgi:hypothetical protein